MENRFKRFEKYQKLNKQDVVDAMKQGCTIRYIYGVFNYWVLVYPDGLFHDNIRKGACQGVSKLKNVESFDCNKEGYSCRLKS